MRFKTALAAFLLPMALLLGACGANVTAGTVTDKASEQVEQTEQECETETKTKKVGKKTKTYKDTDCEDVPTGEFVTEYTLSLETEEGDTGSVNVDEDEFNSVEVGDFFDSEAGN